MPQDRQFEQRKEGEPLPAVVITAIGYEHSFSNIQGLSTVFEQVRTSLSTNDAARNIVFLEDAASTALEADRKKQDVERFGGLTGFLVNEVFARPSGRVFNVGYVEAISESIRSEIAGGDFSGVPIYQVHNFVKNIGLDDIRAERYFDVEFEAQTAGVVKNDNASYARYEKLSDEAYQAWAHGQFDQSLIAYKKLKSEIHTSSASRNPGIAQQIRALARDLSSSPQGGNIVLLLGESHLPVIDMLQRQMGNVPSVRFDKKRGRVVASSPEGRVNAALTARQQVSDLEYAQANLLALVNSDLARIHVGTKNQTSFMVNYEEIYLKCSSIIGRLSMDEIRQLCENRVQLGQHFLRIIFPVMR